MTVNRNPAYIEFESKLHKLNVVTWADLCSFATDSFINHISNHGVQIHNDVQQIMSENLTKLAPKAQLVMVCESLVVEISKKFPNILQNELAQIITELIMERTNTFTRNDIFTSVAIVCSKQLKEMIKPQMNPDGGVIHRQMALDCGDCRKTCHQSNCAFQKEVTDIAKSGKYPFIQFDPYHNTVSIDAQNETQWKQFIEQKWQNDYARKKQIDPKTIN
jgi:hypothetical protein